MIVDLTLNEFIALIAGMLIVVGIMVSLYIHMDNKMEELRKTIPNNSSLDFLLSWIEHIGFDKASETLNGMSGDKK